MNESVPVPLSVKTADLKVRTLSALVMLAVAGGALWAGGVALDLFIYAVALVCYGEFLRLVLKTPFGLVGKGVAVVAGAVYIGAAGLFLAGIGTSFIVEIVLGVIATDVGAYFAGRTIGGPKIAPRISPSKTWAGLGGGALLAALVLAVEAWVTSTGATAGVRDTAYAALFGAGIAVCAQAGDFLESWLKRKAAVKDSSNLIPGHGGIFDRIDGLVAVAFVLSLVLGVISRSVTG